MSRFLQVVKSYSDFLHFLSWHPWLGVVIGFAVGWFLVGLVTYEFNGGKFRFLNQRMRDFGFAICSVLIILNTAVFTIDSAGWNNTEHSLDSAGWNNTEHSLDSAGWDNTEHCHHIDGITNNSEIGCIIFRWWYSGLSYSMSVNLSFSDYSYFKNLNIPLKNETYDEVWQHFITYEEPYLIAIAKQLGSMAEANEYYSDLEKAEFILAFVGAIKYQFDNQTTPWRQYTRYPIEMLWEATGDCEDAAILYASLMEAIGYDAVLIYMIVGWQDGTPAGHIMPAIHIENFSGDHFLFDTGEEFVPYFAAEATSFIGIGRDPWRDLTDEYRVLQVGR